MEESYIKIYDHVLSDDLCDSLVNLYNKNLKYTYLHDQDYRRCNILSFPHTSIPESNNLFEQIRKLLHNLFDKYKKDIGSDGGGDTLNYATLLENPNIICYNPNEEKSHHFNRHADNWNFDSSTRVVSVIIYMNDVQEGGSTVFPNYKISIKPKKGSVLLFPSYFAYMHYGEAPISNQKYIIVSWIHFGDKPAKFKTVKL